MDKTVHRSMKPSGSNTSNAIISGIVGVSAGLVAAVTTLRREFFDDVKSLPDVKEHFDDVTKVLEKRWMETKEIGNLPETERKAARFENLKEISDIKLKRDTTLATILEEHGYRAEGLRGLTFGSIDRFRQLSKESKTALAINSVITAAIAIGGTYTFLSGRHTRQMLDAIVEQQPENNAANGR